MIDSLPHYQTADVDSYGPALADFRPIEGAELELLRTEILAALDRRLGTCAPADRREPFGILTHAAGARSFAIAEPYGVDVIPSDRELARQQLLAARRCRVLEQLHFLWQHDGSEQLLAWIRAEVASW